MKGRYAGVGASPERISEATGNGLPATDYYLLQGDGKMKTRKLLTVVFAAGMILALTGVVRPAAIRRYRYTAAARQTAGLTAVA